MSLNGVQLAEEIRVARSFPLPVSENLIGWGTGVVQHIQGAAITNNPVVTGTTPPGGSLSAGASVGGIISGLSGSAMAGLIVANSNGTYPFVSQELLNFCNAIVQHIQSATVVFSPGSITGQCTNTPMSSGPLVNGQGSNGFIVGLSGTVLASLVTAQVPYPFVSPELIEFCTAVADHITNNAEVIYSSGQVTGTCPAGGGGLIGGTAINGQIL